MIVHVHRGRLPPAQLETIGGKGLQRRGVELFEGAGADSLAPWQLLEGALQGDAGALEFLVDGREVGGDLVAAARQSRYSRASSSSSVKVWASAQTTAATRASNTYLPATLLEILSARPTSL